MTEKKPKKILMTADTVGGVWSYTMNLLRELKEHEVQVTLVTMGKELSAEQRNAVNHMPYVKVVETSFALEWMDNPWQDVEEAGKMLQKLAADEKPDLIHLNNYSHAALDLGAPKMVVAHSCVFSWWRDVKNEDPDPRYEKYFAEVQKGLRKADMIVAPTSYMLKRVREIYNISSSGAVVPNGIDESSFRSRKKESLVITLGRLWDESKNMDVLEEASALVRWPVVAAGETLHPATGVKKQFRNLNVLGKLSAEEVAEFLSKAAIYAHPARYEPFGLSVLEAALSGCALVLADIPSLKEVWGDTALYASPTSPEEFAEKINTLANDPAERESMALRSLKRAKELSAKRKASLYYQLYQQLLN